MNMDMDTDTDMNMDTYGYGYGVMVLSKYCRGQQLGICSVGWFTDTVGTDHGGNCCHAQRVIRGAIQCLFSLPQKSNSFF